MTNKNLTRNILIGMALGAAVGSIFNLIGIEQPVVAFFVKDLFPLIGSIFVRSLQLLVVPLVLCSLICGTAALDDVRRLGRIGAKTVACYLATTAVAIAMAITLAVIFQPGKGFTLDYQSDFSVAESPPLTQVLLNIFPSNPFQAMAEGNMLQVIVFAILFGIATCLSGEPGKRVLAVVGDLNEIVLKLVTILLLAAPFGVFALVARTLAQEGFTAILALGQYFFLVLLALLVQLFVTYGLMVKVFAGLNPFRFFRKMRRVQLFGFSTASSNATLPLNLENAERHMGIKPSVGSFTIPLGATINMDGTAIMQGVATVFIAQALAIDIGIQGYLMVILTATLASVGTAGVPGVGLVMLAMVFQQVGLPVAAIGVIYGVDRLLDMVRTAVNLTGDVAVSAIVAKSEGEFDQAVFDKAPE
jgi:Na+/H+-dicarboxylate symporter